MTDEEYLKSAGDFADATSTCMKVAVGSCYVYDSPDGSRSIYYTSNMGDTNCKKNGYCQKYKLSGIYESCEETRHLCAAKHSEIRMIDVLKKNNVDPSIGTLYVTRYPCIRCATEVSKFGFTKVVYGGVQKISNEVEEVFKKYGIEYKWIPEVDNEFNKENK